MKDQIAIQSVEQQNAGQNPEVELRLVEWTLDKQSAEMIQLAQRYGMRVVITFDSRMGVDDARFEMTNPTKNAPNGTLYLTVPSGTGEDEVRIILKRTPNRLLRSGSQLIVTFEERMYWKLPSEPVKARIVDFWENEVNLSV